MFYYYCVLLFICLKTMEEYLAKYQPKKCIGCDAVGKSTARCYDPGCVQLPAHYYCLESCKKMIGQVCVVPRVECKKVANCCPPLAQVEASASLVCQCGSIFCLYCSSPSECLSDPRFDCVRCVKKRQLVAARNLSDSLAAASSAGGSKRLHV